MDKKELKNRKDAIAASAIVGAAIPSAMVIKHNVDTNKQQDLINSKRVKNTKSFYKKILPGDVIIQGYSRKSSYYPFSEKIPIKNSDLIHSFYGNPYSHMGIYAGKGKVIHSLGAGYEVGTTSTGNFLSDTNVAAIRYGKRKDALKALRYAKSQIGTPYMSAKDLVIASAKDIIGINPKACKGEHTCTTMVNRAHKIKNIHEHPLSAVKRGDAKIIASHNSLRKTPILDTIPRRIIYPLTRSIKYAVPGAAIAGLSTYLIKSKKDNTNEKK
jgi:hypothetical protein